MNARTPVTNSPHSVSVVSAIDRPNITDDRGIGQGTEPVVHARRRVLGHAGARRHPQPQDPGHEEARHQEVDVVHSPTGMDGAPKM